MPSRTRVVQKKKPAVQNATEKKSNKNKNQRRNKNNKVAVYRNGKDQIRDIVLFSGCLDNGVSYESEDQNGQVSGRFTQAFCDVVKNTEMLTYQRFFELIELPNNQKFTMSYNKHGKLEEQFKLIGEGECAKKALIIGINYVNMSCELSGCWFDAQRMLELFKEKSVNFEEIRVLSEYEESILPTRENIVNGFKWLLTNSKAGDVFFVYYSGHGTFVRDASGDERDGNDEAICPLDFERNGLITDDEIKRLISVLHPAARLTILFDSCHSGTAADLSLVARNI